MPAPEEREFRLAIYKLHTLHHAAKRPMDGLWLLQELAEHGHMRSVGMLNPLLAQAQKNGWLR